MANIDPITVDRLRRRHGAYPLKFDWFSQFGHLFEGGKQSCESHEFPKASSELASTIRDDSLGYTMQA